MISMWFIRKLSTNLCLYAWSHPVTHCKVVDTTSTAAAAAAMGVSRTAFLSQIWFRIQTCLSFRLVALPRLKGQNCPTISQVDSRNRLILMLQNTEAGSRWRAIGQKNLWVWNIAVMDCLCQSFGYKTKTARSRQRTANILSLEYGCGKHPEYIDRIRPHVAGC